MSDPSPANWSGQLYLDLYNTNANVDPLPGFTVAKGGNPASCLGASSPCNWADGQPVVVPPVLSLDLSARLVLNVATGGQSSFTNTGTNFVYSITETPVSTAFQANVNWFLNMSTFPGIDTGDTAGAVGSRVSGPMTVFNGNLYFASFSAPASTTTCTIGTALLWGMNFNTSRLDPRSGRHAGVHATERHQHPGQLQPVRPGGLGDRCHPGRVDLRDAELRLVPDESDDQSVRRGRIALHAVGVHRSGDAVRAERPNRRQRQQAGAIAVDQPSDADGADPDRLVGGDPRVTRRLGHLVLPVLVLPVLVLAAGCGKPEASAGPGAASTTGSGAPGVAASSAVTPADHLAAGELIEGTEQAFGLTLPRGVAVESRLPGVVNASGPVGIKPLVTYLRDRLEGGSVHPGETSTTLEHVKPRGQPGPLLDIYIAPALGRTVLQVVQTPEAPPSTLPDEPSRWKAVGLTPEGKLLDPKHVE